jgi:serine protease Do
VSGEVRKMETAHSVFLANMVILPGMSGGPVFKDHRLVGLVNAVMQAPLGFGMATPVAVGLIIPLSSVCEMLGPNT